MKKTGMSRRRFMKVGLACTAGTALDARALQLSEKNAKARAVSRTSLKPLREIPTTCEQCPAGCGIIACLNGERLVQVMGNPAHPNNRGSICAKGLAGINLVNDPERLLYPMKRTGARGEGKWSKITWDEAFHTLSLRVGRLLSEGRQTGLVIDRGECDPILEEFITLTRATPLVSRSSLDSHNRRAAFLSMLGTASVVEDAGRSRTIFNFGANPYAGHDHFVGIARRLVEARVERGARLVTFDVRMSETAAGSDAWYPVKPGTDAIVALAMARIIVEKGLADSVFLERKTDCSPALLRQHLAAYTPETAEKESGVPAAVIVRLAEEFAVRKPSLAIIGGGASEHENGVEAVRCISLLNWLVGGLEHEGGIFFPRVFERGLRGRTLSPPAANSKPEFIPTSTGIRELFESGLSIDTFFVFMSNPAYEDPDCLSTGRLLKDEKAVPFIAAMDTHMTETGTLADLVLPAATYFEGWGVCHAPSLDGRPIVNLRQPVVSLLNDAQVLRSPDFEAGKLLEPQFRPRGESLEVGSVCLELARRIGGSVRTGLPFKSTKDYVTASLSTIPALKGEETLGMLKNQGFWVGSAAEAQAQIPTDPVKIVGSSPLQENAASFPRYLSVERHRQKGEDEFILTSFKSNLWSRGTANSKWAREILHENRLWVNKEAATRLGLKNGDRVKVTSAVGTLVTRVLTTNLIHPDSVAMACGLGHTEVGLVAQGRRFKSPDRDTALIWWSKQGNGSNPNEIIDCRTNPADGSRGMKDTVVRIEKA